MGSKEKEEPAGHHGSDATTPWDQDDDAVYSQLLDVARRHMAGQPSGHTLQATALAHEAWARIADRPAPWRSSSHLIAAAGRAMRCVLVDHARRKGSIKRTPPGERVSLDEVLVQYQERAIDLVALDQALDRLAEFDPEMAQAVEMKFFGGLSVPEVADVLGISGRTLERRWSVTRRWLQGEIA